MHRIDTPLNVAGQFVGRNTETGAPGTRISAAWLNSVQGEIITVIISTGVDLDKSKTSQLLTAINAIIEQKISESLRNTVSEDRVLELISKHAVTWE